MFKNIAVILTTFMLVACGDGAENTPPEKTIDTTPPVITLNGESFVELDERQSYNEAGATAIDETDGAVQVTIYGQVDVFLPNTYELTYSAQDRAGNSVSIKRTVLVNDITPPNIQLEGYEETWFGLGQPYVDSGVSIYDNVDVNLTADIQHDIDINMPGSYIVTYTVMDSAGNVATATRTVHYIDEEPPVITLLGEASMIIDQGQEFVDPGATAMDAYEGEIVVTTHSEVDTKVAGYYYIRYYAEDSSGNSNSARREVLVNDVLPPEITLVGESEVTIEYGDDYVELGATALDNVFYSVPVSHTNNINSQVTGTYFVTYTASDFTGNTATLVRTVHVVDSVAPVFSTLEANEIVTYPGFEPKLPEVNATDNYDETIAVEYAHNANLEVPGTYELTISAEDSSGNVATKVLPLIVSSQRPFILTFATDNEGLHDDRAVLIQSFFGESGIAIDWGDGSREFSHQYESQHTYASVGVYTVKIYGELHHIRNNYFYTGAEKIISVEQWGDIAWQSMDSMFVGAADLTINATDLPNLENVTSMKNMFERTNLTADLSQWDVSNVTNMSYMFSGTRDFNSDLSQWDVSNVTTMAGMFSASNLFNSDISGWDVSSVTDMSTMFNVADAFNQDISNWDVSSVTNMHAMFRYMETFNPDLSNWNVSNVTNMSEMFSQARSFNQDLSSWDVSNVTSMREMFYGAEAFNADLSQWNVAKVTDMTSMFYGAQAFNSDLSGWQTDSLENMANIFKDAASFNSNLNNWNVSKVTDMTGAFDSAASFNGNISDWDVSNVTNMTNMFRRATQFNQSLSNWNVSNVTSMRKMFTSAMAYSGDMSNWDVGAVTNMSHMFYLSEGNFSGYRYWDVANVENMFGMFAWASNAIEDIGSWDVSKVTEMRYMFFFAELNNIDLQNWDVSSVTNMEGMFGNVNGFNSDISAWDISQVTDGYIGDLGLTTEQYDALLNAWALQDVKPGFKLYQYYALYSKAGEAARNTLLAKGWDIKDAGLVPAETATPEAHSIAPEITMNGSTLVYKAIGERYDDESATATDNIDNDVTITVSGEVDYDVAGTYTLVYTATDSHGNTSTAERTIVVTTQRPFITTWQTDIVSHTADNQLMIQTDSSSGDYFIDWGDGNQYAASGTEVIHTYDAAGTYTVKIYGEFKRIINGYSNSDSRKLVSIDQWGDIQWSSMKSAFVSCENMQVNAVDAPDLSLATDVSAMFYGAKIVNADFSHWDMSNITVMSSMFSHAYAFNGDISTWDVSNVTTMNYLFESAKVFNQDIGQWDVSKVTNMINTFAASHAFNQDLSAWQTGSVTTMSNMFNNAHAFTSDLSNWNVSAVTNMSAMFYSARAFNSDLSGWDVSNVQDMSYMFSSAKAFNSDISTWLINNVENMDDFFSYSGLSTDVYTSILNNWSQQIVKPNVVLNMGDSQYYESAQASKEALIDIGWTILDGGAIADLDSSSSPDTSEPENDTSDTENPVLTLIGADTAYIYIGNTYVDAGVTVSDNVDSNLSFELLNSPNINEAGTYEVTYQATDSAGNIGTATRTVHVTSQKPFITSWKTDNIGVSSDSQISINTGQELNNYYVDWGDGSAEMVNAQIVTHTYDSIGTYTVTIFGEFKSIYNQPSVTDTQKMVSVDQWGDISWTTMNSAFYGAENITFTATDAPDLSQVTDMSNMFRGVSKQSVNFNHWNVSTITNMSGMFKNAQYWQAKIGQWDVASVTDMSHMFSDAEHFYADLSQWDTGSLADLSYAFYDLSVLHINPGLWDVSNVTNMEQIFGNTTLFDGMYSVILYTWSQQNVNNNITMDANLAASHIVFDSYKNSLITKGWVINDNGSKGSYSDSYMFAPEVSLEGDYVLFLDQGDAYVELGADATDDNFDDVDVIITGSVDTSVPGHYQISYSATDNGGNTQVVIRNVFVE